MPRPPKLSQRARDDLETADTIYALRLQQLIEQVRARSQAANRSLPDVTAWRQLARPSQLPPTGPEWRTWFIRGGRGSGKSWSASHTFAEWVTAPDARGEWAIIAPTYRRLRRDCLESTESGLLAALGGEGGGWVKSYNRSTLEVHLASGAVVILSSSEDGALAIQGKNLRGAWCEEVGLWQNWETAWDESLRLALRKGQSRVIVTGTPKYGQPAAALIKRLLNDPTCYVSTLSTFDNAANLSARMLDDVKPLLNTRLGRQELYGELLEDNPDALWSPAQLDRLRVEKVPVDLVRLVVAMDPAMTDPEGYRASLMADDDRGPDETGIVVAGLGEDGHGYVLADLSGHYAPWRQAETVAAAYHAWQADLVVVERNNGGDYIPALIATVDASIPVAQVTATRGKYLRAEPISAAYAAGRVHHVGYFPELEAQMCTYTPFVRGASPDRLDALVWALTELHVMVEALSWGDVYKTGPRVVDERVAPEHRAQVLWAKAYEALLPPTRA